MPARLDDPHRLAALTASGLLDSEPEPAFDRLTRLATHLLDAPVALLSLVDDTRQFFKTAQGLGEPWSTARGTGLTHSFCQHVVTAEAPLVVPDARLDPRVRDNLAVPDLGVIAYLGVPVRAPGELVLGAMCAIAPEPRAWSREDLEILADLAALAEAEVERRLSAEEALRERAPAATYLREEAAPGAFRYVHPGIEKVTGHPAKRWLADPDLWREAQHPDDRALVAAALAGSAEGRPLEVEYRLRGPDGQERWVWSREEVVRTPTGPPLRRGVLLEVTAQRDAQAALRTTEQGLRAVVEAAPMILFALDAHGVFTLSEGPRLGALGLRPGEVVGRSVFEVFQAAPEVLAQCQRALAGESFEAAMELAGVRFEVHYRAERDEHGRVLGVVGVATDVTERHRQEQAIARLAYHDLVTGLPNRARLEEHLAGALARARRHGSPCAVLYVDLDHFKLVNDSLGHEAGDAVLREVAHRLSGVVRATDLLARQGGDEFVVVAEDLGEDGETEAGRIAEKLLGALREPVAVGETEFQVGASVGLAVYPRDGLTPLDLLRRADTALYEAKQDGRGGHRRYRAAKEDPLDRLTLPARLRRAIARDELVLHYQPVIHLPTGLPVGVEALVRWEDPEQGLLGPGAFVPVAEESELIHELGAWVANAACRQARAWGDLGAQAYVAFNVSPRQLRNPDFARELGAIVAAHGVEPDRLVVELTEAAAMRATEDTPRLLAELDELGVGLAIDDFGTGYSCLARLRELPVDMLKVDGAFLRGVPEDVEAGAVLAAILELAAAAGLDAVGEGVETEAQREFLELGCVLAQGYHLGRPAPAEVVTELLLRVPAR